MSNHFDKILKEIFSHAKTSLIKLLIEREVISIRPLASKLQQTTLELEADTVAEVITADGENFIAHIEWQSTNDGKMNERMLLYNCMLRVRYQKAVLGAVVYLGNATLNMSNKISSYGLQYNFRIIDVRELDPEWFLASGDPAQWIFAILAGKEYDKTELIKKILFKLQVGLGDHPQELQIKLKQMEVLSLLRGKHFQQKIIEEENKMPITIDITQDVRYNAGIDTGKLEAAEKMIMKGFQLSLVQEITGLDISFLEMIAAKIKNDKSE